jgi:hypothetical protein
MLGLDTLLVGTPGFFGCISKDSLVGIAERQVSLRFQGFLSRQTCLNFPAQTGRTSSSKESVDQG